MSRRTLTRDEEIKLMVHCAQLYYNRDHEFSQAEVADALGINPTKVSRILRQAQNEGIVEVSIHPPRIQQLELKLMDAYSLKEAVVVPSGDIHAHDAVGKAAAEYFTRATQDNISIGLAPGYSIQKMIDYLEILPFSGHKLYPLATESTSVLRHFYPTQLASLMLTKYKDDSKVSAYTYRIPSKPADDDKLDHYRDFLDFILDDSSFKNLMNEAAQADIMLMGIGSLKKPDPALNAFLKSIGISAKELLNEGAVGMINYQFFDAEGRVLTSNDIPAITRSEASLISIPLSEFSKAARTFGRSIIGLAGASYKIEAIKAALKGRFFNILITDVNVAEGLLAKN